MRVLQLKHGLGIDGASQMVVSLANAIGAYGVVFDVLIDEPLSKANEPYVREISASGGRVLSIEDAWNSSRKLVPHKLFKLLYSYKVMRSGGYEVAHLQTDTPSRIQMLMVAKAAGIRKRIVHSHNSSCEAAETEGKRQESFRRKMGSVATGYIACSDEAAEWLFPHEVAESRSYLLLKNGVRLDAYRFDVHRRAEVRASLGLGDEAAVACIGRLAPQKNLGFALNVLGRLVERGAPVSLVVVGDGDEREALVAAAGESGLSDRVRFLGARNDVADLLQGMDALLMPSLFEGLPVVLVEAQAASLPCVVSDTVSRDADIGGDVTFVSLDEDIDRWADAVLEAAGRPRGDISDAVRNSGYTIEESAKELAALYGAR